MSFLSGYKTYIIGSLTILIGLVRLFTGETKEGMDAIMLGLTAMSLRAGVSKCG